MSAANGNLRLTLHIWRQDGPDAKGHFDVFSMDDVSPDMSFLEMIDVLNERLTKDGQDPVAFDFRLRPGSPAIDAAETTIAWVITTPMLFSAVALPMLGKLGDLKGHRRVFLFGSTSAAIIAATTSLAWSAGSLIALRTLASVLGGATQPSSMALIFRVIPPVERTRAMGWWSMTGAGAPAVGLIAGGPLVDLVGWRSVFILQAVFAFCALLLAWLVLPETPPKKVRFDVPGALTLALGVGGLLLLSGLGAAPEGTQ